MKRIEQRMITLSGACYSVCSVGEFGANKSFILCSFSLVLVFV